jgi:hypothetical protein
MIFTTDTQSFLVPSGAPSQRKLSVLVFNFTKEYLIETQKSKRRLTPPF